jgi:hypothetical protein
MSYLYFSDRERGARPRTSEEIGATVWAALRHQIETRIEDGSFGYKFPENCHDGAGPCGCDQRKFDELARAEIPNLPETWLRRGEEAVPDVLTILDVLEFSARAVAKPVKGGYHSFFQHYHLDFDREPGLREFVADVNRLFARNGIAFELTTEGRAVRTGPALLREALTHAAFHTGDAETDRLLEDARRLILSPHLNDRRNALEKLWDAFERIKTIESGGDKKAQVTALLNRTAQAPRLRGFLETEAKELTTIGNSLQIRHFEMTQEKLERAEDVDYLFHRMFSFIRLVLRTTGREG